MIEVSIVDGLAYIRHSHKITSTILIRSDYEKSRPEKLIEPGLISNRKRKRIKPIKFYEDNEYVCYYKDKQFWIGIKPWKPGGLRRKLWDTYKDTGECWFVPADFYNRAGFFRTENEALDFISQSVRKVKPKHVKVRNPEDIEWIIKMPWVSLLLEDLDIAKEWNEYAFNNHFEYPDLSDWYKIIKAFREWEKGNDNT